MKITVQGEKLPPGGSDSAAVAGVTVRDSVGLTTARAGTGPVGLDLAPGELLEIETADGALLWLREDELAEQLGPSGAMERGVAGAEDSLYLRGLVLPASADGDGPARGLLDWPLKRLSVLKVDGDLKAVARDFEGPEARMGLRRWGMDGALTPITLQEITAGRPWLLFLHGTASTTQRSFGRLMQDRPEIWAQLHAMYPGRIIAYEHRTLSLDPVQNAQDLLDLLPERAQLHLVSHSRGGLVGELIALSQLAERQGGSVLDRDDLAIFAPADQPRIEALGQALAQKDLSIARFVRVACPARGTSLAGGRLDRWLNLLFNAARFGAVAAGDEARDLVDGLHRLALAASANRDNPEALPGIAAMAPEYSPLLSVLNRPRKLRASDGLVVIAGDIEPSGVAQRLGIWFADAFFGSDHDLVVNTGSMTGGVNDPAMTRGAALVMDRGQNVSHFRYFTNGLTAGRLLAGLRDPASAGQWQSPELRLRSAEEPVIQRSRAAQPAGETANDGVVAMPGPAVQRGRGAPLAVILPGISGSHLGTQDRLIWCNPLGICTGGIGELAMGKPIRPYGVIETYYGGLRDYLGTTHQTLTLAYDWRLPIQTTGAAVARLLLDRLAEDESRPIHIVGHSMGGLLARVALTNARLMQGFLARPGSRFLMLGTPNGGSLAMALALLGHGTTVRALAALSLSQDRSQIAAILRAWPGAVQLLPPNLLEPSEWAALAGDQPLDSAALTQAREFWRLMADRAGLPAGRCLYLAGMGSTCDQLFAAGQRPDGPDLRMTSTPRGDGTVLYSTGIPTDVPVWFAPAAHGDLPKDRRLHPAIAELLLEGRTDRLARQPATRDAAGEPTDAAAPTRKATAPETLAMIPSPPELLAMVMGGRPPAAIEEDRPSAVVVRMVHGDLRHARHPILVGHTLGDGINGAERTLDGRLNERLTRRNRLGLHPGLIGNNDVHLRFMPGGPVAGADVVGAFTGGIVVGLGVASGLTTGGLTSTIRNGLLAYADAVDDRRRREEAARLESPDATPPDTPSQTALAAPLGVSAVLVGSGNGVVSVADSVWALLNAVEQANRLLDPSLQLREVEVIEAVEQVAVTAWHAVRNRVDRMQGTFQLAGRLEEREGRYRRTGPEANPDSWMEITITAPDPSGQPGAPPSAIGPLHYLLVDGRARVEAETVATNRRLVRHFAAQIPSQPGSGDASGMSAGRTLFELLWPARLKQHSLEDRNLRLVLDRQSAAIPWEMLDDRRAEEDGLVSGLLRPPSVRYGVLRQLVSQMGRPAPPRRHGQRRALVIGDPRGGGSPLPMLPGARREAETVASQLEANGYTVQRLIGEAAQPQDVVAALFSRSWSVIHVAGHGVVDWQPRTDEPPMTGIVLGAPPLDVLEAPLLAQLPEPPDLFFLNCCHLGAISEADQISAALSRDRPGFASSLAVGLIERGCPAVIACGWQVDDSAALRFAATFYSLIGAGADLGAALKDARQATFQSSIDAGGRDNTWGAYQCYGHPGFTLTDDRRDPDKRKPDPASANEALALLQAETARSTPMLDRVDDIAARIREYGWQGRSDLISALGDAYAASGRLDLAIDSYRQAAMAETPSMPVSALQESLWLPLRLGEDGPDLGPAIAVLEALNRSSGASLRRLILLADLHQRQASLATAAPERRKALEAMLMVLDQAIAQDAGRDDAALDQLRLRALLGRLLLARAPNAELSEAAMRQAMAAASHPLWPLIRALSEADPALLPGPAQVAGLDPVARRDLLGAMRLAHATLRANAPLAQPLKALLETMRGVGP